MSTKAARSGDKESIKLVAILEKCQAALNDTKPVRTIDFSKEERPLLQQFFLITAKPAMFVANVAEDGFENNPLLDRLKALCRSAARAGGGDLRQAGSRNVGDERRRPTDVPRRNSAWPSRA